jgi:hypothetical protein
MFHDTWPRGTHKPGLGCLIVSSQVFCQEAHGNREGRRREAEGDWLCLRHILLCWYGSFGFGSTKVGDGGETLSELPPREGGEVQAPVGRSLGYLHVRDMLWRGYGRFGSGSGRPGGRGGGRRDAATVIVALGWKGLSPPNTKGRQHSVQSIGLDAGCCQVGSCSVASR